MKINSKISAPASTAACLIALVLPGQVLGVGLGVASFHPTDALDSLETVVEPSGFIQINPGLDPVSSNEDYSHTYSIEVDQATGRIRGYAGYTLDNARAVTRTGNLIGTVLGTGEPALVSNVSGGIVYNATVNGSGSGSATVFIDVNGSFNYQNGAPSLGLLGVVQVGVAPGGDVFNATTFLLGGQYLNADEANLIPDAGNLFTRETYQVFDALGMPLDPAGFMDTIASVEFLNTDPAALSLRVGLTVPLIDGDVLTLGGTAAGAATHAFLEDFRDISVGETGQVDAASGFVDFRNTGSISIVLPPGYSLDGPDAPPLEIITTVPLPPAAWLFLSGLVGLVSVAKRRR